MKIADISENFSGAFATSMGSGNGFANGGPGVIKRVKKTKKNETKKVKESVYAINQDNPNNPEVLISGYGRMNMDTLKATLTSDLQELASKAESDDWDSISYTLQGVFSTKLKALLDAQEELEGIRKKGGSNSRGINKR